MPFIVYKDRVDTIEGLEGQIRSCLVPPGDINKIPMILKQLVRFAKMSDREYQELVEQ